MQAPGPWVKAGILVLIIGLLYTAYVEPFLLYHMTTWIQEGVTVEDFAAFRAEVHLRDGSVIERRAPVE